jgi:hypothetical protein
MLILAVFDHTPVNRAPTADGETAQIMLAPSRRV